MGRLGLGVLVALGVGCGGNAERRAAPAGGSAGAIAGGAGIATGGAGMGGAGTNGGAGQGGVMSIGGGGTGGIGGMWACKGSSVVEYPQGPIAEPTGFSGTIDGTLVKLRADAPDSPSSEPGTLQAVAVSCSGMIFELHLYFDAPFAGESLVIAAFDRDVCQIQGQYSFPQDTLGPFGATVELKLEVWANEAIDPPPFFRGSFTADVRSPDGIPVRTIQGDFAVQALEQICI